MAEVEPASRPRALPGRRHREARDAWLRQCTGTEHSAAVAYLSAYPLQEIPRGAARVISRDVRCLLANPATGFDDFVRLLAGGRRLVNGWYERVPYGLNRADLPGRAHWWADLLGSCLAGRDQVDLGSGLSARGVAEWLLQLGDALIRLAWPDLEPADWAAAYLASGPWGRQSTVVSHAAADVRRGSRSGDDLTRSLVPNRGIPRLLTRHQAMNELDRQLTWGPEALEATAQLRARIVEDALAGASVHGALDLLPLPDRTQVAAGVAPEAVPRWLGLLLATTPLPAHDFARHCECDDLGHLCAVLANPYAPLDLALRALGTALRHVIATPGGSPWHSPSTTLMRAILTARGWLPESEVAAAIRAVVSQPTSSVDSLALALAQAPAIPRLDADTQSSIVARLGSAGPRVPSDLVRALPFEAQAACIRSLIEERLEGRLGDLDYLEAVVAMDEETRVLAARHGREETLSRLAQDPCDRVRAHVARNSSSPRDLLVALASDPQDAVASQVARNARVDPGLLAMLARRGGRCGKAATRVTLRALG